jgi:hypothetical protein
MEVGQPYQRPCADQDTGLVRRDLRDEATSSLPSPFEGAHQEGDPVVFEGCTFHFVEHRDRDLDVDMTNKYYLQTLTFKVYSTTKSLMNTS